MPQEPHQPQPRASTSAGLTARTSSLTVLMVLAGLALLAGACSSSSAATATGDFAVVATFGTADIERPEVDPLPTSAFVAGAGAQTGTTTNASVSASVSTAMISATAISPGAGGAIALPTAGFAAITPTPVPTFTPVPTLTPVPTPTLVPTPTAVPTATPQPEPSPTATETPQPTAAVTPSVTSPIVVPEEDSAQDPLAAPTFGPTAEPTRDPSFRFIADQWHEPFATIDDLTLVLPSKRVELVGLHQAGHTGSLGMTSLDTLSEKMLLPSRSRGTDRRGAADIVVEPDTLIFAPVSGTVLAANTYTLYCDHTDSIVVIEPDGHPGWETKILHISDLRVSPGQWVQAGETIIAGRATILPFESQIDEFTAVPAWPHVHIETIDTGIPDERILGSC